MDLRKITELELGNLPKKYTSDETDLLRSTLKQNGYDLESFFEEVTNKGFFVCSSRRPIEDSLQVRHSNYALNGKKYLHYMKIPYFAFITALHDKLDLSEFIDSDKAKHYANAIGEEELMDFLWKFPVNPNSSYHTRPEMHRGVTFESFFIHELMKVPLEEYINTIRERGMLKKGYIYVVEDHGMVPSHKYPKMEFHCFQDIPFIARIPISRELDWKYETKIRVQEIRISDLHLTK